MPPAQTTASAAAADSLRRHCADDRGAEALYLPDWSAADWAALLQHARPVVLARNEVLIKRGQAERSLFLVASGALEVRSGSGGSTMGALFREGPGAVIGEISFFDGDARSATVWSVDDTCLFALDHADIDAFAAQHARRGFEFVLALGRVLAFRIRRSEQRRPADAL